MTPSATDPWGVDHRGNEEDVAAWGSVVHAVVTHHDATATRLDGLLERSPDFAAATLLKGFALMFKGRRDLLPVVDEQLLAARTLKETQGLSPYESLLFAGLCAWREDNYNATDRALQNLVDAFPTNLLAVKLQHGFLFLAGRRERMTETLEGLLPLWTESDVGYGYVLGCASFAFGELDRFEEAERLGRAAVEHEPDDAWGIHAVSHVYEMRDDNTGGAEWLEAHRDGYTFCNNFRGHVFWHLALFELALNRLERVWALCDDEVRRAWCGDYRDMSNVASLLWRLEVDGFDVGPRWQELAEIAHKHHTDHGSAFADAHYALALGRAGDQEELRTLVESIRPSQGLGQARIVAGVGRKLCTAIAAYGDGRLEDACELFSEVRESIPYVGGSNAQRDLFEQIEIHAALGTGDPTRIAPLMERRLARRPHNPWALERV